LEVRRSRNKTAPAVRDPRLATALDRFSRLLEQKDLRLTKARAAIVEAALARDGHFPIDDLVQDLRRRGIRGSKATVYRALPLLTEAGILQPASSQGDARRYEAAFGREHHDHLVCRGCGKVVEFEYEAIEILQREVATRHGFTLEAHQHQLFGRCEACRSPVVAGQSDVSPAPRESRLDRNQGA
jgi:Fur family transcriptional regulator, ferric uptake regulator